MVWVSLGPWLYAERVIPTLVESPIMSKLNSKQQRFVQEYLIDLNATAAYKRAGYKCSSDAAAQAHASRLLGNAEVQAITNLGQTLDRSAENRAFSHTPTDGNGDGRKRN
jgi:hypothetical protein